jgi:hypothetical protein
LPKEGHLTECKCWREIALLSLQSKKFSRIILDRIKTVIGIDLRMQQDYFRQNRYCIDLVNTLRIILEQASEWNTILCVSFIDFEKAFDFIKKKYLWHVLQQCGIPDKTVH